MSLFSSHIRFLFRIALEKNIFGLILLTLFFGSSCRQGQPKELPTTTTAAVTAKPNIVKPDSGKTKLVTAPANAVPDSSNLNNEKPKPTVALTKTKPAPEKTTTTAPGWPVKGPEPLPGAILPANRVMAFYGNPLSKGMGILGELEPEKMFAKLDAEVAAWQKADPATPVKPAFHVIVVTAQGKPSAGGKYRLRMTDAVAEKVLGWAEQKDALVFLDLQIGQSSLEEELPRLAKFLQLPNVHLGIDAEFAMKPGQVPGRRVGSYDAADINYATKVLADLVTEHQIPPKILVIHRFTQRMITNYKNIKLDPRVQIVMHMDGWGSPELKKGTYNRYIKGEPVQYTGFKLFYKNDRRKKGWRLMTPEDILKLYPQPVYIQYQ